MRKRKGLIIGINFLLLLILTITARAAANENIIVINNNLATFTAEDIEEGIFFEELDDLGRVGMAFYIVTPETLITSERESISSVEPTGWQSIYIDGEPLYNRCHIIGFQLSGLSAIPENLFTGTRYLNVELMLPIENQIELYVRNTGNSVLYRVMPYFYEDNLLASFVHVEAYSVETEDIRINQILLNVQPGVTIDYATGRPDVEGRTDGEIVRDYVLNKKTQRIHLPECDGVKTMKEKNRKDVTASLDDLMEQGYKPCGTCLKGK